MSTRTRLWVPVNTSLHVFQWRPFTLIQKQVTCKRHTNINLIYTRCDAYVTSELMSLMIVHC